MKLATPTVLIIALVFLQSVVVLAESDNLQEWIETNSISVSSPETPLTPEELKVLDTALRGKRVVFLGEAAHWVHEKYDYRLRFLKYLVGKGFHHIGMEMGYSDGARIDRFLGSGNVLDLDRVALFGYSNDFLRSRTIEGYCSLAATPHHDFADLYKREEIWFYSQIHRLGKDILPVGKRLHHFGFDIDTRPGGAYEDMREIIRPFDKSKPIAAFSDALAPVPHETLKSEISRLKKASGILALHEASARKVLGKRRLTQLKSSLRTLVESLQFMMIFQSRPCNPTELPAWNEQLLKAMAEREKTMFELMKQKVAELGPDAKIVLMGHNFHLSKKPKSLWFVGTTVPESFAPTMWPSIGEFVSSNMGLPVYSIWMMHRRGFQSNIDCPQIECAVESGPTYFGEMFSGLGSSLMVSLATPPASLNRRLDFAVNGGTYSGNIAQNADLIFFVDTVSGLRPR